MQSGAFIQLIVLFAGLASRMATLSTEMGGCVRDCEAACDRVLSVIDVNWSMSISRHVDSNCDLLAEPQTEIYSCIGDFKDVGTTFVSSERPASSHHCARGGFWFRCFQRGDA
jgi:hypothetical protein